MVGSIKGLDQLAVTIDEAGTTVQHTPEVATAFSLPVKIALFPPVGATGTVHISVDGLSNGVTVAQGAVDASLVNGRAEVTLTLLSGMADLLSPANQDLVGADLTGADLSGADLAVGDLASCASVNTCQDGDGCCPAKCNNSNDHDCTPVCGNHVVETGEVCDDGNSINGDGCDPTCQWFGITTTLSGKPGACGYADGNSPRFVGLAGSAFDDAHNKMWVSDDGSATIRQLDVSGGVTAQLATTIIGKAFDSRLVDGAFADARIASIVGTRSLAYLPTNGVLYFTDSDAGQFVLRAADMTSGTVTTVSATAVNQPIALAIDPLAAGTAIYYLAFGGDLHKWNVGDASSSTIATGSAIGSAGSGSGSLCSTVAHDGATTYVGCATAIAKVTDAGVATLLAGGTTMGCVDNATGSMAEFNGGISLLFRNGTLWAGSCNAIREIDPSSGSVSTFAGQLGVPGYADWTSSNALFNGIASLAWTPTGLAVVESNNCAVRTMQVSTMAGAPPAVNAVEVRGPAATSRFTGAMVTGSGHSGIGGGAVSDGTTLFVTGLAAGTSQSASMSANQLVGIAISDGTSKDLHTFTANVRGITRIGTTLYVSLNDGTIHSIDADGSNDTWFAGMGGNTLYPPSDGTAGNPRSAVMNPSALGTDGTDLYFVDAKLVRKLELASGTVSLVAGEQDSVGVMDGVGGSAHLNQPEDLAYAAGNLYTLDTNTYPSGPMVVRRITLATRDVHSIVGQTDADITDVDGIGVDGQLAVGFHLATDGRSLFISEALRSYENSIDAVKREPTIRQLDLSSLSLTTMIGTRGQATIQNGAGTKALLHYPTYMTFDSSTHSLFVFDLDEGVYQKIR